MASQSDENWKRSSQARQSQKIDQVKTYSRKRKCSKDSDTVSVKEDLSESDKSINENLITVSDGQNRQDDQCVSGLLLPVPSTSSEMTEDAHSTGGGSLIKNFSILNFAYRDEKGGTEVKNCGDVGSPVSKLIGKNKRYYNMLGNKLAVQPITQNKTTNSVNPTISVDAIQNGDENSTELSCEDQQKNNINDMQSESESDNKPNNSQSQVVDDTNAVSKEQEKLELSEEPIKQNDIISDVSDQIKTENSSTSKSDECSNIESMDMEGNEPVLSNNNDVNICNIDSSYTVLEQLKDVDISPVESDIDEPIIGFNGFDEKSPEIDKISNTDEVDEISNGLFEVPEPEPEEKTFTELSTMQPWNVVAAPLTISAIKQNIVQRVSEENKAKNADIRFSENKAKIINDTVKEQQVSDAACVLKKDSELPVANIETAKSNNIVSALNDNSATSTILKQKPEQVKTDLSQDNSDIATNLKSATDKQPVQTTPPVRKRGRPLKSLASIAPSLKYRTKESAVISSSKSIIDDKKPTKKSVTSVKKTDDAICGLGKRQRKKRHFEDYVDPFNIGDKWDASPIKNTKLEEKQTGGSSTPGVRKRGRPSTKSLNLQRSVLGHNVSYTDLNTTDSTMSEAFSDNSVSSPLLGDKEIKLEPIDNSTDTKILEIPTYIKRGPGRPPKNIHTNEFPISRKNNENYYDTGEKVLTAEEKKEVDELFKFLERPRDIGIDIILLTCSKFVQCGCCKRIMKMGYYQQYHRVKRYYLSWLEGEPPLDLSDSVNTIQLLQYVLLPNAESKGLVNFTCAWCNHVSKAPSQFVLHRNKCVLSKNAAAECPPCRKAQGNSRSLLKFEQEKNFDSSSLSDESFGILPDNESENASCHDKKLQIASYKNGESIMSYIERRELKNLFTFLKKPEELGIPYNLLISSNTVQCGQCKKTMKMGYYQQYHQVKHYYLSWLEGEPAIDINDVENVSMFLKKRLVSNAQLNKLVRYKCVDCERICKSASGYASHIKTCNKSATCDICGKEINLAYINLHLRSHRNILPPKKSDESVVKTEVSAALEKETILGKRIRKTPCRLISEYSFEHVSSFVKPKKLPLKGENRDYTRDEVTDVKNFIAEHQKYWDVVQREGALHCVKKSCYYLCIKLKTMLNHFWLCPNKLFLYTCKTCSFTSHYEENMAIHLQLCNTSTFEGKPDNTASVSTIPVHDDNVDEDEGDDSDSDDDDENNDENNDETFDVGKELITDEEDTVSTGDDEEDQTDDNEEADEFGGEKKKKKYHYKKNQPALKYQKMQDPITVIGENLKLRNEILSKNVLNDLVVQADKWNAFLSDSDSVQYLPVLEESVQVSFDNDTDFRRFKKFESDIVSDTAVMFVSGPIHSIAWVTMPEEHLSDDCYDQYLAISCHPHMDHQFLSNKLYEFLSVIQLWKISGLHNVKSVIEAPTFSLGIAHEFGAIWSMEWLPSGGYDNSPDQNRLGILAVATSSGNIIVYSVPFPDSLLDYSDRLKIVKPEPDLILKLNFGTQKFQCTRVIWDLCAPHAIMYGGYSNGTVAMWDITTKSSLLKEGNVIYPFTSFSPHKMRITALAMHFFNKRRYLLTGSADCKIYYWNLEDKCRTPIRSFDTLSPILDGCFIPNKLGSVTVCDQIRMKNDPPCLLHYADGMREKAKKIHSDRLSLWSVSSSPWSNSIATCADTGIVSVMFSGISDYFPYPFIKTVLNSKLVDCKSGKETTKSNTESNSSLYYGKIIDSPIEKLFGVDNYSYEFLSSNYGIKMLRQISNDDSSSDKTQYDPLYPLLSANKVSWNPNFTCFQWLAVAYQSGFLRLCNVKHSDAKELGNVYENLEKK